MVNNVGVLYLFGSGSDCGSKLNSAGDVVSDRVDAKEQQLYVFMSTSFFF